MGNVLSALLLLADTSSAGLLPPASVELDTSGWPYSASTPVFGTQIGVYLPPFPPAGDFATASPNGGLGLAGSGIGIVVANSPGVADPAVSAGAYGGGVAAASVNYMFAVTGPGPAVNVPIDVSVTMGVSTIGGGYYTTANAFFDATPGVQPGIYISLSAPSASPNVVKETLAETVPSGVYQNMNLEAIASSDVNGSSFAYVDPTITIDPTFASTHPGYSLEFSPNVAAVPESSTGVIGALALLLSLVAGRRWSPLRRRTS